MYLLLAIHIVCPRLKHAPSQRSSMEVTPQKPSTQIDTDASDENDTGSCIAPSVPDTTDQQKIKEGRCANALCDQRATKTCKGCLNTRYCSRECQKKDWDSHREGCPASSRYNQLAQRITHLAQLGENLGSPNSTNYSTRPANLPSE